MPRKRFIFKESLRKVINKEIDSHWYVPLNCQMPEDLAQRIWQNRCPCNHNGGSPKTELLLFEDQIVGTFYPSPAEGLNQQLSVFYEVYADNPTLAKLLIDSLVANKAICWSR